MMSADEDAPARITFVEDCDGCQIEHLAGCIAAHDANERRCGSQGVDEDGHCKRCGLVPDGRELDESAAECPPGFLAHDGGDR